jgi:hypothetical protein
MQMAATEMGTEEALTGHLQVDHLLLHVHQTELEVQHQTGLLHQHVLQTELAVQHQTGPPLLTTCHPDQVPVQWETEVVVASAEEAEVVAVVVVIAAEAEVVAEEAEEDKY